MLVAVKMAASPDLAEQRRLYIQEGHWHCTALALHIRRSTGMAALSDWQRPALSSSYKYIMFVWNLKPRVKEVALVPWFVALLQNGEWKLCGKGAVFTLRDKAAGEAGYIEEKQVAKILGRSLQRLNLSAGHRSAQQQFNKLYFCFLYLCISSLKTFLRGRVQFNHSIVFLFLLLVILGVTDQIPLLESHCP